jgi:hypothetical protein
MDMRFRQRVLPPIRVYAYKIQLDHASNRNRRGFDLERHPELFQQWSTLERRIAFDRYPMLDFQRVVPRHWFGDLVLAAQDVRIGVERYIRERINLRACLSMSRC